MITIFWNKRTSLRFNDLLYFIFVLHAGTFTIKNIKATPEGESAKVKVKARINLNGIFTISSASLIEKREPTQQEKEEEDAQQQQQQQQQNNMDVDQQQEKKDKADQEAQANEPPATEVRINLTSL